MKEKRRDTVLVVVTSAPTSGIFPSLMDGIVGMTFSAYMVGSVYRVEGKTFRKILWQRNRRLYLRMKEASPMFKAISNFDLLTCAKPVGAQSRSEWRLAA